MENACYYSLEKILSSHLLSKKLKLKTYKTIILQVVLVKVKVSPLQAMKADGGYGYKGSHIGYTATVLGRGRVASPTLGRLYPRRRFPVFIYKRLSGPQDESGQEGVNKNLHPSDSRDRTWTVQPVAKRPAASATRTTFVTVTSRYLNFSTFSNNKFPITVC